MLRQVIILLIKQQLPTVELLVLQMLDGVGSCVQTGTHNSQQCKDVQCIMEKIRPIRLCKLTKFASHLVFNMLRTVPTIVIAHTFCASRDTRVSYR